MFVKNKELVASFHLFKLIFPHPTPHPILSYAAPYLSYAPPYLSYAPPYSRYALPDLSYAAPYLSCAAPYLSCAAPSMSYAAPSVSYAVPSEQRIPLQNAPPLSRSRKMGDSPAMRVEDYLERFLLQRSRVNSRVLNRLR
jgi:hypothetical protein